MEAQLHTLPTAVVEPPVVGLLNDAVAIAGFGLVLSPHPITAADLSLESGPRSLRLGGTLRLRLSLPARHATQSTEELEVSLGRLAVTTRVDCSLHGPVGTTQPLPANLTPDSSQHCLYVSLEVPLSASSISMSIDVICVAGQVVPRPPLRFRAQKRRSPSHFEMWF